MILTDAGSRVDQIDEISYGNENLCPAQQTFYQYWSRGPLLGCDSIHLPTTLATQRMSWLSCTFTALSSTHHIYILFFQIIFFPFYSVQYFNIIYTITFNSFFLSSFSQLDFGATALLTKKKFFLSLVSFQICTITLIFSDCILFFTFFLKKRKNNINSLFLNI